MPVETKDAEEKDAFRQFPANFMVFTSGEKTPQDLRSGSVYTCFSHVSKERFKADVVRPKLLGVASDTMPWNALQKTRRVGVTVRGAVTVAVNKDELAGCQIGDMLEYRVSVFFLVERHATTPCLTRFSSMIQLQLSGWVLPLDFGRRESDAMFLQSQFLHRA